jgi:hypothetical protein
MAKQSRGLNTFWQLWQLLRNALFIFDYLIADFLVGLMVFDPDSDL